MHLRKKGGIKNFFSIYFINTNFKRMSEQILNNEPRKNIVLKRFLKIIGIPVLLFFIIGTLVTYNENTHSIWSCGYAYLDLPIPDYLKESKIIFEKPVYGMENVGNRGQNCLSVFSDSDHGTNFIGVEKNSSTPDRIADGTIFTVYKRVYITCGSISCMDSGGGITGDSFLLKDQKGEIWEVDPDHFDPKKWGALSGRFLFKAGYYKNGERLGDVTLKQNIPENLQNVNWLK
jgi:hypothetical protein